jgi:hypothetical protein
MEATNIIPLHLTTLHSYQARKVPIELTLAPNRSSRLQLDGNSRMNYKCIYTAEDQHRNYQQHF